MDNARLIILKGEIMITSKKIDIVCIIAIILGLAIVFVTIFAMAGEETTGKTKKYESTIFDNSYVHTINIEMKDWDSFIETCENEEYATCNLTVDGTNYSNIAIRAKGNTSLSNVSQLGSDRYSLKIEFDHYQDGVSLDGLDKLCLNNLIQDNTMMKDYIAYTLMDDFSVDAPLCSYVYVTVNGEDWGLYLAVEGVEDSFLSRNYGYGSTELYKPDSLSFGGGRGNGKDFNMDDFDFSDIDTSKLPSTDDKQSFDMSQIPSGGFGGNEKTFDPSNVPENFDMSQMPGGDKGQDFDPSNIPGNTDTKGDNKGGFGGNFGMGSDDVKLKYIDDDIDSYSNIFDNAKTDVTKSDKKRLIESLKKLSSYEDLEEVLDMDEVLRYFVVHNFVCNGDSYTGSMIHNYYLSETDGKLAMIPWDYNLAFGTFQGGNATSTINTSIDEPVSNGSIDDRPMVGWIFSDDNYTSQYHELFKEFIDKWFTNNELEELIEKTYEMIKPYVEKDPTKFCTTSEFDTGVVALKQFINLRGEKVGLELSGSDETVDATGLNLSDMGSMGGTMGKEMTGNDKERPTGDNKEGESKEEAENNPSDVPQGMAGGDKERPTGGNMQGFDPNNMPQGGNENLQGGQMPQGGFGGQMPNMRG